MSELGSDRFSLDECQFDRKLVMLAVDSSPESRGAVRWAAQSLFGPGDQVLIFHAIKVLKEIPTASELAGYCSLLQCRKRNDVPFLIP
jgi:hypothetical protein